MRSIRAEKARRSLIEFAVHTFAGYRASAHHREISDALQAVERGDLQRLMIFIPPRHGKSEIASIRFPAWYLGRNPQKQVIGCSYSADLAHTFSRAVRDTINSEAYQDVFPGIRLDSASQAVSRWRIAGKVNKRSSYIAAGVGGPITGEGADLLVIDDPVKNAQEAESEVYRNNTWEWYITTARTRLHPGGAIVLIMTRWHQDDLAGRLLEKAAADPRADQWQVLHLPAIDDAGGALWPDMYDIESLEQIRASIGNRQFEALYQGRPTPPEGALFKRAWFDKYIDQTPSNLKQIVRYWDLAASRGGDYTAGALVGVDPEENLYILDIVRMHGEWPEVRKVIIATAQRDGYRTPQGIEVAGMQTALYQDIMATRGGTSANWRKVTIRAGDSKEVRASPWAARAEAGKVYMMRGDWNAPFIDELCDFPYGRHDDQVDAVSGADLMLNAKSRRVVTF